MTKAVVDAQEPLAPREQPKSTFWGRQLPHYPSNRRRAIYLGLVVLITVQLYYELYVGGSVAPQIIAQFGFSLKYFIFVSIIGNAVGAAASVLAGLADRWGRANLVVGGLLVTVLLILFGVPNVHTKVQYLIVVAAISLVEGMILVATPALIRDFSPQLGRASAMGFWTLGPVIGSLVVTSVSSNTLPSHPDWQFQFRLCGVIGMIIFVLAFFGVRELSPKLRDQLMVSIRDKMLIEARAAGIKEEELLRGSWQQMLSKDVVLPAFAISIFLLFYYILVGFFVIYYALQFGYTESKANGLANWYWATNAITLVVIGVVSDRLRVRKPFMVLGALISAGGLAVFAVLTTHTGTTYYQFALLLSIIAAGGGIAYCAWMAAFTETVERHNPAATATGLAVWGGIIRSVVTLSLLGLILAVPSAGVLVDHGAKTAELAAKYSTQLGTLAKLSPLTADQLASAPDSQAVQGQAVAEIAGVPLTTVATVTDASTRFPDELATAQAIDPATAATLASTPTDPTAGATAVQEIATKFGISPADAQARLVALGQVPPATLQLVATDGQKVADAAAALQAVGQVPPDDLAYLNLHGVAVQRAQANSAREWQRWWWISFACQLAFLPFVFLLVGRWSPRKAAEDARRHSELVDRELAELASSGSADTRA
jgi:MFS transporter, ACS family, D-galactonate transporter